MSEPAQQFLMVVSLAGFPSTAAIHRFLERPGLPALMVNYLDYDRSRLVKSFHDLETARQFAEQTLRALAAEPAPVRVTRQGLPAAHRVNGFLTGEPGLGPGGWIRGRNRS
jgi:hypothetical protein